MFAIVSDIHGNLEALTAVLARSPRPVHLVGDGIPAHRAFIPADAIVTPADLWRPRAAVVARLGTALAARGQFIDADRLVPVYIRRAEAEEKWDAALGGMD